MKLTRLLVLAFMLFGSTAMLAQDIHFSQFYLSPMTLNPALTGVMDCNSRFTVNYRNQWASVLKSNAFNTYSVGYDMRMPVGRYDYFGGGITLWGDKAGESSFSTMQVKLSGAYSKRMGGDRKKSHYLVIGGEFGVSQRSIDFLALRYGTQFNGQEYQNDLPTLETTFDIDNYLFLDMSVGALWFTTMEKGSFYIGGAFGHLNRANQSFDNDEFIPLYSKLTVHVGGDFMLSKKMGVVPSVVIFSQGPSMQVNGGASLKFMLGNGRKRGNYQAFQVGAQVRVANNFERSLTTDAVIASTRFDLNNVSLGFSYDINVSGLKAASNGNGAFEISMIYKICKGFKRRSYCPKF